MNQRVQDDRTGYAYDRSYSTGASPSAGPRRGDAPTEAVSRAYLTAGNGAGKYSSRQVLAWLRLCKSSQGPRIGVFSICPYANVPLPGHNFHGGSRVDSRPAHVSEPACAMQNSANNTEHQLEPLS